MSVKSKLFQFFIRTLAVLATGCLGMTLLHAQPRSISGKVVDAANEPVAGASVIVVGDNARGTMTDIDGSFSLSVPQGSSLSISCIGYTSQTISVGDRTSFLIVLAEDNEFLEETVVIGYGVQKKSDLTGAIASVKDSDLANRSAVSAAQALQGKAAGVQIVNASGAPGSDSNIQIRGYSSNTTTRPLMIVDGLKVSDINYLDPDNIASIEVLKDAASAAIYGIEAGNGVILVTTKSGKTASDGTIFYNLMTSIQSAANLPDLMDAATYVKYQGLMGNDVTPYWDGRTDTYWPDYMLEKGHTSRHTIGAQAANDKANIFISLSHLSDDGIIAGDKDSMNRLSGQINAEYKIKPWFTVGTNNSIERNRLKQVSEANGINASTLGSMLVYDPIVPWTYDRNNLPAEVAAKFNDPNYKLPTDAAGNPYGYSLQGDGSLIYHPAVMRDRSDTGTESFNLRGSTYANLSPVKGLVITSRFGYRAGYSRTSTYNHAFRISSIGFQDSSLSSSSRTNLFYQWENFANYSRTVGKHSISAMAGFSFQKSNNDFVTGTAYSLTDTAESYRYLSYSVNDPRMSVSGVPTDRVNLSYYGRLSWSYANRYMVQANFRADAYDTSKLDPSNRWGYFPSVSAGWTLSNERFMDIVKDRTSLTFLKLRASWGVNGNVNAMGDYQYSDILAASNMNGYNFTDDSGRTVGVAPTGVLPNPKIKWETSRQVDLGVDMRFLSERLSFSLDWYNKNTDNLITSTTAPANTGSTTTYINAGKVNNHGTEIEVSWKDTKGDFSYGINGNFATLRNKVLEGTQVGRVAGYQIHTAEPVTYFEAGYPLWYLRLYEIESIDQETGAPVYADNVKDGVINDDDRICAGSGIPDFTYGLTLNLAWKGLDLVLYGTGAQGVQKLYAMTRADNTQLNTLREFYTDAWQSPSSTSYSHPKPNNTDAKILCSTDRMFDASFFKIKQIQLGYTFPKKVLGKLALSNLRVYVSFDDFFTFTRYPGLDPETSLYGSSSSGLGVDTGSYPISKKIVFGLNLSL